MKLSYFLLTIIVPAMMIACDKPAPSPEEEPGKQEQEQTPTPAPTPEPEVELAPEIKSGDCVLAPNAKTIDALKHLDLPAGVDIELKV